MAKNILAVYDPCHVYIERFLSFVNAKKRPDYEFVGFTDINILKDFLSSNRIRALIFSQENIKGGEKGQDNFTFKDLDLKDAYLIFLGENQEPSESCAEMQNVHYLNKYQSMEDIMIRLGLILAEGETQQKGMGYVKAFKISGIYSPSDKLSHPEVAVKVRKKKIPAENRVLYINLEPFSGCSSWLGERKDTNIADVIYVFKTNPGMMAESIGRTKGSYYGMDVLTAPDDPDDLEELTKESWPDFLAELSRAGDYQNILVDMSSYSGKIMDAVMKYGNLYIPALPFDPTETYKGELNADAVKMRRSYVLAWSKMEEFRRYVTDIWDEEYLKKIVEVRIDPGR